MELERLRECLDLAETLNFTKTAANLYITQPVLSKHIANVEQELGFAVFERTKRSVKLTPLGKVFIEHAQPVVQAFDEMMHTIRAAQGACPSSLRIGYLSGAAGALIPYIQSGFALIYPDIEVDYITYEFSGIAQALEVGSIDIAVAKIDSCFLAPTYEHVTLFEDRYYAACDMRHPLSEHPSIKPADLTGLTVALPGVGFYTDDSQAIIDYLRPDENDIVIRNSVRDMNSLPILVQSQDAIGVTFGHLRSLFEGRLAFIPLDGFNLTTPFGVIWKKSNDNPAIRDWAKIAREVYQREQRA